MHHVLQQDLYDRSYEFAKLLPGAYADITCVYKRAIPALASTLIDWCGRMRGDVPVNMWNAPTGWDRDLDIMNPCAGPGYREALKHTFGDKSDVSYIDAYLWGFMGVTFSSVLRHWAKPDRQGMPDDDSLATQAVAITHVMNTRISTAALIFVNSATGGYSSSAKHTTVPLISGAPEAACWSLSCVTCGNVGKNPLPDYDDALTCAADHQYPMFSDLG